VAEDRLFLYNLGVVFNVQPVRDAIADARQVVCTADGLDSTVALRGVVQGARRYWRT
jgi:endonuclease V-like protein UPF0215 family